MKKKAIIAAMISAIFFSFVVRLQNEDVAKANFVPQMSVNRIWSPENKTYTSNLLTLNVSVSFFLVSSKEKCIAYSLDGNANVTVTGTEYPIDSMWHGINITVPLLVLSDGAHCLYVYAQSVPSSYASPDSKTVFFTVNSTAGSRAIVVPHDFSTIQAAIDGSAQDAIVFVEKGTYTESIVINKPLTLVGEDRNTTSIVSANGLAIKADNVSITGFSLSGPGWRGISVETNNCNISGNNLSVLRLVGSKNTVVDSNFFEGSGISSAIQLNYAENTLIRNNFITSCTEGIQIWQTSANNTVVDNTITDCEDQAIRLQYSRDNTITRNNITRSGIGTSVYGSSGNIIQYNNYVYNVVQFSANESYYLSFGNNRSVNFISGNYWSDYSGKDQNGDGIGDTPYVIDANNQDNFPLMKLATNTSPPIPTSSPATLQTASPTVNPTATQIPNVTPYEPTTPKPTSSPTFSFSPTQQPTTEPSTTLDPPLENLTSAVVIVGAVIAVVAVGLLVYFATHGRMKR